MDTWNLQNKKTLTTGGTKGIGLAIAEEFLELGAEVIIVARDKELINKKISEWESKSKKVLGFAKDLSLKEDRESLIKEVKEKWETLNILVNNVGTNIRKKTVEYSDEE